MSTKDEKKEKSEKEEKANVETLDNQDNKSKEENPEEEVKELSPEEQDEMIKERQKLVFHVTNCTRTLGFNLDESGVNVLIATIDLVREKGGDIKLSELEGLREILRQDQLRAKAVRDAARKS